ncbi:hypothetical protein [Agaribacter flavus]|uniref:Ribosomal subunit interface protein n=1 Tax=Agaribacter flavus TaxID=1902781 RepID=A0ABV7FMU9_9ALTE
MQHKLNSAQFKISETDRNMIDTRLALSLSRYVSVIDNFIIDVKEETSADGSQLIVTETKFNLSGTNKIHLKVKADNLENAITQLTNKAKRTIDRHLKHRQLHRISTQSVSRL